MTAPMPPASRASAAETVVIWGAGGHAKVVAESARRLGWRVAGFIDDVSPERSGEAFCGAAVLGGRSALAALRERGIDGVVLAFGANAARVALGAELAGAGWRTPALVDPGATVAGDAEIGAGCYVGVAVVIQPGARIGAHCIVNTGAIVEHDAVVAAGVHLAPRACVAGHAVVGRGSFVGAGAVVRDRIRVGADAVVGMGAVVVADLPDGVVAYGNPARVVRVASP